MRVWCFTPNPVRERKFVVGSGQVEISAGGKGRNVARQLCLWGVPAISKVINLGSDPGTGLVPGVGPGAVPGVGPGTIERWGWAWVSEGEERIDFFTEDLKVRARGWARIGNYWRRVLRKGDWWVVGGSSAEGWPRGWWRGLIQDLQKKGVSVLVDSRGALLREAVQAGADWVKCNLNEAEVTTGKQGADHCLPNLRGDGTTGVVVTMGDKGLVAEVNRCRLLARASRVKVKDPTGAGDAVTAAIIYGEIRGWTTERTLRMAARVGAWRVSHGTDVPRVCLKD